MKLIISLFICISANFGCAERESVKFSAEDARLRRDAVSYSTSVIHQNSEHPDQHAESSVKVDFHTNQVRNIMRQRPLSSSDQVPLQQTFVPQKLNSRYPQENHQYNKSPQSQAFNVGYSVRFNGKPQKAPQQSLQTAEIITGSRNRAVQKPSSDFDAEEFVNNALIDIKKQKVSGIKPKPNKYKFKDDSKSFIANLAPKTQQYLSYLGDSKPIPSSNSGFRQQLLPKILPTTESFASAWTSLSPTVEIYHSKNLLNNEIKQSTRPFDHVSALGKSQGFDYSNVVEDMYSNFQKTEQSFNPFASQSKPSTSYKPLQALPLQQIQFAQTPSESVQTRNVPKPQLPVDTSLLRDPVLTTPHKNVISDQHTLPIPFDTTLLQAMQQKFNFNHDTNVNQEQLLQATNNAGGHSQNLHTLPAMHHVHLNGKQQPTLVLNNENFDQYFSRYLENAQPQETRVQNFIAPFHGVNFNNRGKDIEMDLRPPPVEPNRSSRLFIG